MRQPSFRIVRDSRGLECSALGASVCAGVAVCRPTAHIVFCKLCADRIAVVGAHLSSSRAGTHHEARGD